ncbi:MAG: serine O-acetyltransferase EpsC [Candidatus Binatia bacterium]
MKTTGRNGHADLDAIVDAVAASYAKDRTIDSLESAALPNQRKIVEALDHIVHSIYMGFYSTRRLNAGNLRHYVGEHLYSAFEILSRQIARAVVYERQGGGEPDECDRKFSEKVVLEVLAGLPSLRDQLHHDVEAAFSGDPAARTPEETIYSYPAVDAITVYRVAHEFYLREVPLVPRIMSEHAHGRSGIDIHPGAVIGRAFFIDHGTGVVIGETAVIGDNVKIYQGVTLGALSLPRDESGALIRDAKRHPTIEDGVTIYAGATILGGETVIGKGSVVGGNVWLTESVPPNTKVTYSIPLSGQNPQTVEDVPVQTEKAVRA